MRLRRGSYKVVIGELGGRIYFLLPSTTSNYPGRKPRNYLRPNGRITTRLKAVFRYCTSFRISHGSEVPKVLTVSKQPGYLADINQA